MGPTLRFEVLDEGGHQLIQTRLMEGVKSWPPPAALCIGRDDAVVAQDRQVRPHGP